MNKKALKIASTNLGAGAFMDSLTRGYSKETWEPILDRLYELDIVGTDAYVLWSDICHKDIGRVFIMCTQIPDELLKDACSRQDYSGKKLLDDYLMENCYDKPLNPETLGDDVRAVLYLGEIKSHEYKILHTRKYSGPNAASAAMHAYAEIPNPPSQVVVGKDLDDLKKQLKQLNENISNPKWVKELLEFI